MSSRTRARRQASHTNAIVAAPATASFGIVLILVVFSGFAALVYEILWFRQLGLIFGNTVQAAATVLAAFMLGLAWGAHRARRWAVRATNPIRLFALLEAGIGLCALIAPLALTLLHDGYRLAAQSLTDAGTLLTALRFAFALLILLLPTTLMGASLPVLAEAVLRSRERFGSRVGWLYGCNTAGATLGVLACGFVLVPVLGMHAANLLAAAINLTVGAAAWLAGRTASAPRVSTAPRDAEGLPPTRPVGLLTVAAACGFLALALETIWFRALVLVFGATTYSFTLMVAIFLVGLALGSGLFGRLADQPRRAAWTLAGALTASGLWTLFSVRIYDDTPEQLLRLLARFGFTWPVMLMSMTLIAGVFLLPLAALSGFAFTALARLVRDRTASAGPALSAVFSVNSLGSAAGAVAAGFALLPGLGLERSLLALGMLAVLLGVTVAWRAVPSSGHRRLAFAATALLATALLRFGSPHWEPLLLSSGAYFGPQTHVQGGSVRLRDSLRSLELLFYQEGKTATVAVTRTPDGRLHYSSQGKVEADTSAAGMSLQRLQGHLPMLLHPQPRRVLNIGLGAGVTAGALTCYPDVQIDVVDIEPAATAVARVWSAYNHDVISRNRIRLLTNDGRNHLLVTTSRYDVITSDPFEPVMAGAASLYTVEHFVLARSRLAPGGLMAQFLPLYELSSRDVLTIQRSFLRVFPRSAIFFTGVEVVLIGLGDGAETDFRTVTAKFALPEVRASLAEIGVDRPERLLEMLVADLTRESVRLLDGEVHTDDRPIIEYSAPKSALSYRVDLNLRVLLAHFQPIPEIHLRHLAPDAAASVRQGHEGLRTLLQGCVQRSTGDLEGSLPLLREAARQAPANRIVRTELTQTLVMLADAAQVAGQRETAAGWYREALQHDPTHFWALYHLTGLLADSQPEQAREYLNTGLAAHPEAPLLLALRGRARAKAGDASGACSDLQAAANVLPLRWDFWQEYASALTQAGRPDEAAQAMDRAHDARAW